MRADTDPTPARHTAGQNNPMPLALIDPAVERAADHSAAVVKLNGQRRERSRDRVSVQVEQRAGRRKAEARSINPAGSVDGERERRKLFRDGSGRDGVRELVTVWVEDHGS